MLSLAPAGWLVVPSVTVAAGIGVPTFDGMVLGFAPSLLFWATGVAATGAGLLLLLPQAALSTENPRNTVKRAKLVWVLITSSFNELVRYGSLLEFPEARRII